MKERTGNREQRLEWDEKITGFQAQSIKGIKNMSLEVRSSSCVVFYTTTRTTPDWETSAAGWAFSTPWDRPPVSATARHLYPHHGEQEVEI